jgi:hypothetical protein
VRDDRHGCLGPVVEPFFAAGASLQVVVFAVLRKLVMVSPSTGEGFFFPWEEVDACSRVGTGTLESRLPVG